MSQDVVLARKKAYRGRKSGEERITLQSPNGECLRPLRGDEPTGLAAGGWKQEGKPNMIAEYRLPNLTTTNYLAYRERTASHTTLWNSTVCTRIDSTELPNHANRPTFDPAETHFFAPRSGPRGERKHHAVGPAASVKPRAAVGVWGGKPQPPRASGKCQRQRKGSASENGPAPAEGAAPAKKRGSGGSIPPVQPESVTCDVTLSGAGRSIAQFDPSAVWLRRLAIENALNWQNLECEEMSKLPSGGNRQHDEQRTQPVPSVEVLLNQWQSMIAGELWGIEARGTVLTSDAHQIETKREHSKLWTSFCSNVEDQILNCSKAERFQQRRPRQSGCMIECVEMGERDGLGLGRQIYRQKDGRSYPDDLDQLARESKKKNGAEPGWEGQVVLLCWELSEKLRHLCCVELRNGQPWYNHFENTSCLAETGGTCNTGVVEIFVAFRVRSATLAQAAVKEKRQIDCNNDAVAVPNDIKGRWLSFLRWRTLAIKRNTLVVSYKAMESSGSYLSTKPG
ncbi:hypothetical protein DFH06DRAFT_1297247 [Mycena polygramma]|nr:hypothetical protein DFH06DRAFT_1297247 [Mycena polygramma]